MTVMKRALQKGELPNAQYMNLFYARKELMRSCVLIEGFLEQALLFRNNAV